ncbi:putative serine protease K12H4.7 [Salminus brasiliensis]|uniref:putative serine protease K12H4.7 n=1 Tax=Salminus brasiliensis TaxID=930266 RepID=UPI003B839412
MVLQTLSDFFRICLLLMWVLCVPGNAHFTRFRKFQNAPSLEHAVDENWFVQRLDHFNGADSRVWKQRYFVSDRFYKPGGPVFLMIGAETSTSPLWMQSGAWLTYAERFGALCLLLEHRFYGLSHPTEDLSLESLRFLSSQQALADLAHFRVVTAESRGLKSSKWVVFGGSYAGSLAAWFRLKYPHLVHASVASSAPVYATVNFPEYLEVVWRSLAAENPECPKLVKNASDTLIARLKDPSTYNSITKDFGLCSKLKIQSEMDSAYMLLYLAEPFMLAVQYDQETRAFAGMVDSKISRKALCDLMSDSSRGEPYDRYAAIARIFSQSCIDVRYSYYLQYMSSTGWSGAGASGARPWVYQTCTEFGFYQSTDSPHQPFGGFPISFFLQQCRDIFNMNASVADAVQQTNEQYGGYDIRSTRIVFPNGSIDPWHALGVIKNITDDLPAIFIKGTAHCADMEQARASDLPQLTQARQEIFLLLQKWLKE